MAVHGGRWVSYWNKGPGRQRRHGRCLQASAQHEAAKDSNHWTWGSVLADFLRRTCHSSICLQSVLSESPTCKLVSCGRCAFQGACGKESHATWRRDADSKQFCWSRGCSRENSYHKNCDTQTCIKLAQLSPATSQQFNVWNDLKNQM